MCRLRRQILLLNKYNIVPILKSLTVQESLQGRQKWAKSGKISFETERQSDRISSALVELRFGAKN